MEKLTKVDKETIQNLIDKLIERKVSFEDLRPHEMWITMKYSQA